MLNHYAFYVTNDVSKEELISFIGSEELIVGLKPENVAVFSEITLSKLIEEEKKYGDYRVKRGAEKNSLMKYSEGERKKALLTYLMAKNPTHLIVDNPYDNLDVEFQKTITDLFTEFSKTTTIIQLFNRNDELFGFVDKVYQQIENSGFY